MVNWKFENVGFLTVNPKEGREENEREIPPMWMLLESYKSFSYHY